MSIEILKENNTTSSNNRRRMQIVTKAITAKARTTTAISLKWAASTIKSTTTTRSKPQSIAILNELQQCKNDNRNKMNT